jgi:hypothetical protein
MVEMEKVSQRHDVQWGCLMMLDQMVESEVSQRHEVQREWLMLDQMVESEVSRRHEVRWEWLTMPDLALSCVVWSESILLAKALQDNADKCGDS